MSQTSHIMQTKPKELGYISGGFCLCVFGFFWEGGGVCMSSSSSANRLTSIKLLFMSHMDNFKNTHIR